ncbi:MAG: hypothetical protein IPK59_05355 [Rhodospirillaceae bacterium]|nr:hypothetical protein [Rhodospirillaceae bacterium]
MFMSVRRILPVVTFAIAMSGLMGCQARQESTSATTPPPATSSKVTAPAVSSSTTALDNKTNGVFDARIEAAMKEMFSKAMAACARDHSVVASKAGLMGCFNEKTALAIDPSGAANENCGGFEEPEQSFKCILMGSMLMRVREQSKVPISAAAWQDIEGVLAGEMAVIALDESFACTKSGHTGDEAARACLADRLVGRLGGKAEDGRSCLAVEDDFIFGQCIGEAAALELIESAATRVGS